MLLQMIQAKQGWDMQTVALPYISDIDEDLNPLYLLQDSKEKRVMRVEDAKEIQAQMNR